MHVRFQRAEIDLDFEPPNIFASVKDLHFASVPFDRLETFHKVYTMTADCVRDLIVSKYKLKA